MSQSPPWSVMIQQNDPINDARTHPPPPPPDVELKAAGATSRTRAPQTAASRCGTAPRAQGEATAWGPRSTAARDSGRSSAADPSLRRYRGRGGAAGGNHHGGAAGLPHNGQCSVECSVSVGKNARCKKLPSLFLVLGRVFFSFAPILGPQRAYALRRGRVGAWRYIHVAAASSLYPQFLE